MSTNFALDRELLKFPKTDAHDHIPAHLSERGKGKKMWLKEKEIDEYLEDNALLGINRICISIPFSGIGPETEKPEVMASANDIVVETVKKYKGRVFGYAFVHSGYYKWSVNEMERCLVLPGMIGIKLYNQYLYNDPVVVALIEVAAEKNALALLHQGKVMDGDNRKSQLLISDGYHIAELAKKVPKAKLICGHIGGGGDWEWTVKALKSSPTVYLDTSGSVVDAGMIEFAARELGVRRLLFATDMSVEEGVGKILGAKLSKHEKKSLFSRNFEKLLKEVRK